jgi:hypothetical protein
MITIPDSDVFFVLSISLIVISILAIYAIKKLVPIEILYRDNPVIGNISALIGIIYGVLAGLTALYLINNINLTSDAVQREANALANIYRDTEWLEPAMKFVMMCSVTWFW